ncbi:MAG: ATP-binding protein [Verrucomicrobiota bacterium]
MTSEELIHIIAGREGEQVEFKPSLLSRRELAEYAVGLGNSGGGWLVTGVSDRPPRRVLPFPWPSEDDLQRIRTSIYDAARIRVDFLRVDHPDGPVLTMRIPPRPRGMVFHTQDGKYLIRLDEGLRGMTLPELDAIRREAGGEITALPILGSWGELVRPAGMEALRELMNEAGAPRDLTALADPDLLRALGLLSADDQLRTAGLLLVGHSDAIRARVPHAQWSFFRMKGDTDYEQAERGNDCLTVSLRRLRELVATDNPIVTIKGDLVHAEFPRYPQIALRELLVNALAHRDFEVPGGVVLKQFRDRIELSNPGAFPADITPENILHHPSTPRYPALFGALARVRLANAANLGVPRAFRDLLSEGKEPPVYSTTGQTVTVTIKGQEATPEFIKLIRQHPDLTVDDLLIVHYLTRHREISTTEAARICQRPLDSTREILARLASRDRLLETGGTTGRGRYHRLSRQACEELGEALAYHLDSRLSRENAKGRVLSALQHGPLSNAQIREITQMSRQQTTRMMESLRSERLIRLEGQKRGSLWHLTGEQNL